MAYIRLEIRLPFLTIGTTSVRSLFRRRDRDAAGPFLIISVSSGLALDTAFGTAQGASPHLWGPHGKPHQLWYMRPSGHKEEVHIVSAANGLSLDAPRGMGEGHQPQMWAQSDVAWKRWRLTPSPDGRSHQLSCEGTGTVLDSPWDAKAGTRPVMWNGHDGENQQWVLALPFGKASADAAR
ncbi:RICIN domain-containing protein [Streptomyces sp. CdTB01]|uniref:RICIN domain-containing protein n=1 Tax=Streptomyces sp. CdTB01 TaxID=1725411 RepID=UPI001939515E|nr:RICIN domain-containing protein [Streptomyces sp. CdTB01]